MTCGLWSFGSCTCTLATMDTNTYREALAQARADSAVAEREMADLRNQLAHAEAQVDVLRRLIDGLEQMVGGTNPPAETEPGPTSEQHKPISSAADQGATPKVVDFTDTPDAPQRKRVRSTELVVDVVDRIGRPASRAEIFSQFEALKGIPQSWVSNPRNSLNNALGRAVENGRIQKIGEEFAPKSYNPFALDVATDAGDSDA